jgi:hypothetical protein
VGAMSLESYLYQNYIDELVNIFEEVLDSWQAGESIEESKQIYDKARQMLPKDRG